MFMRLRGNMWPAKPSFQFNSNYSNVSCAFVIRRTQTIIIYLLERESRNRIYNTEILQVNKTRAAIENTCRTTMPSPQCPMEQHAHIDTLNSSCWCFFSDELSTQSVRENFNGNHKFSKSISQQTLLLCPSGVEFANLLEFSWIFISLFHHRASIFVSLESNRINWRWKRIRFKLSDAKNWIVIETIG